MHSNPPAPDQVVESRTLDRRMMVTSLIVLLVLCVSLLPWIGFRAWPFPFPGIAPFVYLVLLLASLLLVPARVTISSEGIGGLRRTVLPWSAVDAVEVRGSRLIVRPTASEPVARSLRLLLPRGLRDRDAFVVALDPRKQEALREAIERHRVTSASP
ncbi:MAG: hypothetical protein L0G99_00375 [Propionibacteriales bacterium]|nr:hypothetical protein [Propionibacteriales bacterium]